MSEPRKRRQNGGLRNRTGSGEIPQRSANGQHNRSKMNQNSGKGYQRQGSYDRVRKIVQEEGRTARNLVQWSVPIENEEKEKERKPSVIGYKTSRSPTHTKTRSRSESSRGKARDAMPSKKQWSDGAQGGSRPASQNSMGSGGRKVDLRARYWAFLFDNLARAVDEIYQTCEADESVVECKEVIMMLEQCTKDFKSLINRLNLLRAYENAKEGNKPLSLAWEVRKSSPGKSLTAAQNKEHVVPSPTVARCLTFTQAQKENTGSSWADKVRGISLLPDPTTSQPAQASLTPEETVKQQQFNTDDEDTEGWETVQGFGRRKYRNQGGPSTPPTPTNISQVIKSTSQKVMALQASNYQYEAQLSSKPSRSTTDSRESEKENLPQLSQSLQHIHITSPTDKITGPDIIIKNNYSTSELAIISDVGQPDVDKHRKARSEDEVSRTLTTDTDNTFANTEERFKIDGARKASDRDRTPSNREMTSSDRESTQSDRERTDTDREGIPEYREKTPVDRKGTPVDREGTPVDRETETDTQSTNNATIQAAGSRTPDRERTPTMEIESKADQERGDADTAESGPDWEITREAWETQHACKSHYFFSSDDDTEYEELATTLDDDAFVSALTEEEEKLASELETCLQEEQSYLQEIEMEVKRQVEEIDTEPEMEHSENEANMMDSSFSMVHSAEGVDWDTMVKEYDERQKRSWAELAEEVDTRTPGRVVIMHEKLSSPSRKRSPTESWKRHEEKQQKAQELREKLLQEKAERLSTLTKKVEEVRSFKEELLSQRRDTITQKMQRAEEKRQLQLRQKVRKAKDEEAKAMEIAFINTLEAQNKRHDIIVKHQESEARLHEISEERQRKNEEKAAKEAAVEERRKALEAERQARLLEMQERRRQRESEFEQRQLEREKERIEAARTKESEREERIAALNAQQIAHIQQLQKKIQQKQDESARRHKENLDQIREKAFEMSVSVFSAEDHSQVPKIQPYDRKKFCTVCSLLIPSEVYLSSHLQGKKHRQALNESNNGQELSKQEIEAFNLKHISDAPAERSEHEMTTDKERQKALKKRCKKLRTRMAQRGGEYEASLSSKQPNVMESQHKAKLTKVVKDLQKYLNSQEKGPWPQNKVSAMDRALGEICRVLDKKVGADQLALRACGGFNILMSVLDSLNTGTSDLPPVIPHKSLVLACTVLRLACKGCYDNCHYMLFSNKIGLLIDLLSNQLNVLIPEKFNVLLNSSGSSSGGGSALLNLPYNAVCPALMQLVSTILQCLAKNNPWSSCSEAAAQRTSASGDPYISRANDVVSYSVSCGVVDKLHQYFNNVRGPIDQDNHASEFLQHSLSLLTSIAKLISHKNQGVFEERKTEDMTQLIGTLQVTDLVGIVSLLYGMLLHCDAPARCDTSPPELPASTLLVTTMALRFINHIAALDINMLQNTLGAEGTWLEFRHITSYLLWYCQHRTHEDLLHEVILCIGYFCILNADNQNLMHSGQALTVLQQLCSLPFQYFSHPRLTTVLFPTLIACCYNNQANCLVLEQDLSAQLLANFIEEKQLESQQATMSTGTVKKAKIPDKENERMSLAVRMPIDEWTKAQEYFKSLTAS